MKILFVSSLFNPLESPINGDGQRTRLLLRACASMAEVDVVTFAGKAREEIVSSDLWKVRVVFDDRIQSGIQSTGRLKKWTAFLPFADIHKLFPVNRQWESALDDIIHSGDYDFIVSRYFPRTAACGLLKYHDKLVIDFDDALQFFFLNQLTPNTALTTRIRLNLAAKKAKLITHRIVPKIHASFYAEETMAQSNDGTFLPNIPYYPESCKDVEWTTPNKRILFVGQLEYQPNKDGLDHFFEKIYMPLTKRLPNLEMHVVGLINNEVLRQHWQSYPNVAVTGFVDDLRQEYAESQVVVAPVYRCGATNIKLLEAMAMNRACVTTMEAYLKMHGQFENGRDLYAAANDEEFVGMLAKLLSDEKENMRIAHNGKAVMDRYYSFDAFCEIVKSAIVRE